ncbi:MAG: AMP-binding protein [Candidatus Competibacter sp.]|nr:AMP-binding protein [Candidatus Competibacter sp.]MDG4583024.1 AMP-binding protein [Candidatus Competibacter sp.]
MPVKSPLLSAVALDTPIAWWRNRPIDRAAFLRHVGAVAGRLPPARFIFNLCEDRYLFLVAFAAVGANGQTSLLPSSRASLHLRDLAGDYPDSRRIADSDIESWIESRLAPEAMDSDVMPAIPALPVDQVMAVAFTSGSTGRAKPHSKRWGELVSGARQARQRFGFEPGMTVVATVPAQHMYGLETTIMTPLASGVGVHAGRPFFPEDVRAALESAPPPRVLVTTPVHLRACIRAELRWPAAAFLISATAPLSPALAGRAETVFGAPVLEIYGCTEAGSIASRRTLDGDRWRLYDGFCLRDGALSGAHLPEPVLLSDDVEPCGEAEFKLLGRLEDLVNIAGKRTSLGYLNHQLNQIEGVVEGVFWLPDGIGSEVQRLGAAVVAPGLSERQVLAALAQRLDPLFLPRPLLKVERLPRNETGKITQDALRTLARSPLAVEAGHGL